MELASHWMRRASGATLASLAIPFMLLAAAGALTIGGLGGIDSLGQVTAGPTLPDTGQARDTGRAVSRAASAVTAAAAPAAGARGADGSSTPGSGPGAAPGTPGRTPSNPSPPAAAPAPGGPTTPPASTPTGGGGGGNAPAAPAPAQPPAPNPVQQIADPVRNVGNNLPGPVGPVTGEVLDKVLGSPPQP